MRGFTLSGPLAATAVALAIGYYFGVQLGLALTFQSEPVATVWPPNALLLAALLMAPPRHWCVLLLAVLPAHLVAEISLGVPHVMAACWFVSNATEALIGATLILRLLGTVPRFDRVRDVSIFLVVAGVLAPAASSFLDVSFVALVGWRYTEFWQIWRNRTLSNSLAALTLVPIIVMSLRGGIRTLRQPNLAGYLEAAALLVGICVTSLAVFHQSHPPSHSPVLMCAPLLILLWAAFRRGVPAVSFCVAILSMFAIVGVIDGRGPFAVESPETAARAAQAFLIISASSLMLLGAALSELKHAKSHALRQMESLQLALGAARMGTWEWNTIQDRVTYHNCSPSEEDTAPAGSTSLVALLERVEANDRIQLTRAMSKAMRRRSSSEVEFRLRRDDGTFRWISIRGKVIRRGADKPDRMIGVYSDITQQKSEEAQLPAQREQLARVKRIASLGELSASLAHELTQPLTAILSNAQAARRTLAGENPDSGQLDQTLEDIVSEGRRIVEVIRRLRALLLKGELQVQPADANECIREVLFLEQKVFRAKGITVNARLCTRAAEVMIDRVQLQQVLMNLITNACDAMAGRPPDQRHIEITSREEEDHAVKIEIADTGPGIEDTESIFEPFFTTKHRGIGLGLSICRTIIAAHSGRLWASNNATRGATLHIWLPPISVATGSIIQVRPLRPSPTQATAMSQARNPSPPQRPPHTPLS